MHLKHCKIKAGNPSNYAFETLENENRCYLLIAAAPCCTVQ